MQFMLMQVNELRSTTDNFHIQHVHNFNETTANNTHPDTTHTQPAIYLFIQSSTEAANTTTAILHRRNLQHNSTDATPPEDEVHKYSTVLYIEPPKWKQEDPESNVQFS